MRKLVSALAITGAVAATLTAAVPAHASTQAQKCASARNWTACIEQWSDGRWHARAWNNSYSGYAHLLDSSGNYLEYTHVPVGGGNITTGGYYEGWTACASVTTGPPYAVCVSR